MYKIAAYLVLVIAATAGVADAASNCTEICCNSTSNGEAQYYPHETECAKFYECAFDKPKLFICPPGLYFDVNLNVCDFDADCGNRTTTPAPEVTTPSSKKEDDVKVKLTKLY